MGLAISYPSLCRILYARDLGLAHGPLTDKLSPIVSFHTLVANAAQLYSNVQRECAFAEDSNLFSWT